MKKFIVPGLLAGVAALVAGLVVSRVMASMFPVLNLEFANPALFRPWSDPLMSLYFLYPFVLGLILAWFWDKYKHAFEGSKFAKVKKFTLTYWLISAIPGMFITYSSFQVSLLMIISWLLGGLVEVFVIAWVLVKMNA